MTGYVVDLLTRFKRYYILEPNSGCWLWTGGTRPSRNGSRRPIMRGDGQKEYSSRVSWGLFRGPIPKGLAVLHQCDVELCVNPDHLFLGTAADNTHDAMAKGRANPPYRAKLTDREVWEIRRLRGYVSQRQLGKAYGVVHSNIGWIQRGKGR
jgi:hypothetical protein